MRALNSRLFAPLAALGLGSVVAFTTLHSGADAISVVQERAGYPLDDVPGFGKSEDAALRDETIAAWQAFSRETFVQNCMSEASFTYYVNLRYPTEELDQIGLSLWARNAAPSDGSVRNIEYVTGLSQDRRDKYYTKLYNLTSQQIRDAEKELSPQSELAPGIRKGFLGGCYGEAWHSIDSIWNLRNALDEEIINAFSTIMQSDEMASARARYRACAEPFGGRNVTDPKTLETSGLEPTLVIKVSENCDKEWMDSDRDVRSVREAQFIKTNQAAMDEQVAAYASALDDIRGDAEFKSFLVGG
jgi:hypothetical protein